MTKQWTNMEKLDKLDNGISVSCEVGVVDQPWIATIIFQREQFVGRGNSKGEAVEALCNHLKMLVDCKVWEWKVQHEQNILNDLISWVGQHADPLHRSHEQKPELGQVPSAPI